MERQPLLDSQGGDGCTRRGTRSEGHRLTPYEYPTVAAGREPTIGRTERRHSSSAIARVFLFSIACVVCLLLMYIPVYSKVNSKLVTVSGWTEETNRDPKVYVQPGNITLVHDIKRICTPSEKEPLFLLIIVCSSTVNFQARQVIRETWGNFDNYLAMFKAWDAAREKYKDYKFDYDLNVDDDVISNQSDSRVDTTNKIILDAMNELMKTRDTEQKRLSGRETSNKYSNKRSDTIVLDKIATKSFRNKRSVGNFVDLLPRIAAVLNLKEDNTIDKEPPIGEATEEVRFPESSEQKQSEFDIDKVLAGDGNDELETLDYEESNVMKIPPKGVKDGLDLEKVLDLLKKAEAFKNGAEMEDNTLDSNKLKGAKPTFKVVFLLGLPSTENETEVQSEIEEEAARYGDVIQESFIDSYNNLTLKSIMMLKWVVTHCDKEVRYVFKADDDIFVNVPRLVDTIQHRSLKTTKLATQQQQQQEYYIMGSLIRNARPISDVRSKWYAPLYMYSGRIYPRYLSGTGYLMTSSAVKSLYLAALKTPLFHLEDIFITGMCAARSSPRLQPLGGEGFGYAAPRGWTACVAYGRVTLHRVSGGGVRDAVAALADGLQAERCERTLLQKKRTDRTNRESRFSIDNIKSKLSKLSQLRNVFV